MDKVRILFLAASPADTVRLRLGQELRDIREKLQLSKQRERFVLDSREAVRTGDITQAFFDVEPQIVHFSGHGLSDGQLCFEDINGNIQAVKPAALSNLFKLVNSHVKCVILNACYSVAQATAIAEHIPFVIGMNNSIEDRAAIEFSTGFYRALGANRSFKEAYEFACADILLAGVSQLCMPTLIEQEKLKLLKREKESLEDQKNTLSITTTSFFSNRFSEAFPGVRGLQEFDSTREVIPRLKRLLQPPIEFKNVSPIWWFRGRTNSPVTSFKEMKNNLILIDKKELELRRVVAINARSYYECFIYVEALGREPSGLYQWQEHEIQRMAEERGYCSEEFAIHKGNALVTRAEYDDGGATINGKVISLKPEETELVIRYLTPYNFVISAFDNPINNTSFDSLLEEIMNKILEGTASVHDLKEVVLTLPKRSRR